jgi:hypothetical protein
VENADGCCVHTPLLFSFNGVMEHDQMTGNDEHSELLRLLTSPFVPLRLFPPTVNVDGLTNRTASRYTNQKPWADFNENSLGVSRAEFTCGETNP